MSLPGTKIKSALKKWRMQTAVYDMETLLASWLEISGAGNSHNYTTSTGWWSSSEKGIHKPKQRCVRASEKDDTCATVSSITMDDLLIVGTTQARIDRLQTDICEKFKLKRIGRPTRYLGRKIRYGANGTVQLAQSKMETVTVHNSVLKNTYGKGTPYEDGVCLHGPNGKDTPRPGLIGVYGKVVGNMQYLADCTRPDLAFIVRRL